LSPAAQVASDAAAETLPAENAAGAKMLADAEITASPTSNWKQMFTKALGLDDPKKLIGSTIGGTIGSKCWRIALSGRDASGQTEPPSYASHRCLLSCWPAVRSRSRMSSTSPATALPS